MAHLAYVDDSGDEGAFALGCVIVSDSDWLTVHDDLGAFRSGLSRDLGFRMAREMKAAHLVSRTGSGPWQKLHLTQRTRLGVYRAALRRLDRQQVRTLAVVAPDRKHSRFKHHVSEECWQTLFERLERFASFKETTIVLMPDDGDSRTVRRIARRRRRFAYAPSRYGGPALSRPFERLVDDPLFRNSSESYLMQWADLVAHAAFRTIVRRADVPASLWSDLGEARLAEANGRYSRTEPPGLVIWPDRRRPE